MSHPVAPRPSRSPGHAVRRAVGAALATTAICAAAFASVALMVQQNQLDMSVQPASVPAVPAHPAA